MQTPDTPICIETKLCNLAAREIHGGLICKLFFCTNRKILHLSITSRFTDSYKRRFF